MAVVRASKLGETIMNTGPFLRVEAQAGEVVAGPGDALGAPGGRFSMTMAVQAPFWMPISVLVSGEGRNLTDGTEPTRSQYAMISPSTWHLSAHFTGTHIACLMPRSFSGVCGHSAPLGRRRE